MRGAACAADCGSGTRHAAGVAVRNQSGGRALRDCRGQIEYVKERADRSKDPASLAASGLAKATPDRTPAEAVAALIFSIGFGVSYSYGRNLPRDFERISHRPMKVTRMLVGTIPTLSVTTPSSSQACESHKLRLPHHRCLEQPIAAIKNEPYAGLTRSPKGLAKFLACHFY